MFSIHPAAGAAGRPSFMTSSDGRLTPLRLKDQPEFFEWTAVVSRGAPGPWLLEAVDYAGNTYRQSLRVMP
jgi:hypothetical protein